MTLSEYKLAFVVTWTLQGEFSPGKVYGGFEVGGGSALEFFLGEYTICILGSVAKFGRDAVDGVDV